MYKILIVEDSTDVSDLISSHIRLRWPDASITVAASLGEAETALATGSFDLFLVDLGLPDGSGMNFVKHVASFPVIVITSRTDMSSVVNSLESGADDFISKPIRGPELISRVHAVLRRKTKQSGGIKVFADLKYDSTEQTLWFGDKLIPCTPMEIRFLEKLIESPGKIVSPHGLRDAETASPDTDSAGDRMFVSRLRRKIESSGSKVQIVPVRSRGYHLKLVAEVAL